MDLVAFLGVQQDSRGNTDSRWKKFRPSVAICMHEELTIDNYYIIYSKKFEYLLEMIIKDVAVVSPSTIVIPVEIEFDDFYDPMETLFKQLEFVKSLPLEKEYMINITTGTHVNQLAWFKLVEGHFFNAKIIQTFGYRKKENITDEMLAKGSYRIIDLSLSQYDEYHNLISERKETVESFLKKGIVTKSELYNDVISKIEKVAVRNNQPILIDGPTGAGKSNLVKQLYRVKLEQKIISGSFISINCATLSRDTASSVLFGHKKGSFTGALSSRDGLLKKADKGVLFLDEIGELPLEVQGMLLTAIESKEFYPMGSDEPVKSDFVLFTGTNTNLYEAVSKKAFRDDLLARINLWHFTLPGLIERKEDIESNLTYELLRFERDNGCHIVFNKEAKEKYLGFATSPSALWTRNFRDLSASVVRMATLSDTGIINELNVSEEIERLRKSWQENTKGENANPLESLVSQNKLRDMSKFDKLILDNVVKVCLNNESATSAAKELYSNEEGVISIQNPLSRLTNYLNKYELNFKKITFK